MIVVNNRIPVNPAHAEAFEQAFADRASAVDGMPGFVSFQILKPTTEGAPYVVQTFWASRADFENWTSSEAFKHGHARSGTLPEGTFLDRPTLEIFDVIQSTTKLVREE